MKKTSSKRPSRPVRSVKTEADEMRSHYDFDYSKARPNRFAEGLTQETVAVVLEAPKKKRSAYSRRLTSR